MNTWDSFGSQNVGFVWQAFGSGVYSVGFCENLLEASPVSSRANASQLQGGVLAKELAKAEPIGHSGSTFVIPYSVITYSRRVKTLCNSSWRKE